MSTDFLSSHELELLNRTLLWRQGLLQPFATVEAALTRLDGLQAQEAQAPDMSLFLRVKNYKKEQLQRLRSHGHAMRATLHRGTIHLVTNEAYGRWKQLLITQALERKGVPDEATIRKLEQAIIREGMLNGASLLRLAAAHGFSAPHLAHFVLPLARVPGAGGETLGGSELWTLSPHSERRSLETLEEESVLAYLRAFGPASASDFTAQSGLRGAKRIFTRLLSRGSIAPVEFSGAKAYFDLASLPATLEPPASVKVPEVLVLPDFDNALLGFSDRSRIISHEYRKLMNSDLRSMAPILINGFTTGVWLSRVNSSMKTAKVSFRFFLKPTKAQARKAEVQLERLYKIWRPDWAVSFIH